MVSENALCGRRDELEFSLLLYVSLFIFLSFFSQLNYVLNTLLSFNMVIAFLIAVILDNTVPGSRQERGVYLWSEAEVARREPAVSRDYELPFKVGQAFRWVKWVGL